MDALSSHSFKDNLFSFFKGGIGKQVRPTVPFLFYCLMREMHCGWMDGWVGRWVGELLWALVSFFKFQERVQNGETNIALTNTKYVSSLFRICIVLC